MGFFKFAGRTERQQETMSEISEKCVSSVLSVLSETPLPATMHRTSVRFGQNGQCVMVRTTACPKRRNAVTWGNASRTERLVARKAPGNKRRENTMGMSAAEWQRIEAERCAMVQHHINAAKGGLHSALVEGLLTGILHAQVAIAESLASIDNSLSAIADVEINR